MIIIIETITDKTNQRTSPPCYRLIADVRKFTLAAHSSQQPHVSDDSRITLGCSYSGSICLILRRPAMKVKKDWSLNHQI